jgi:chemotaxis protein MotB
VDLGVAADRLTAAGLGESRPIVPNSDNEARARNRRVTLVNLGAQ